MKNKLVLIDGHSMLNRAFYGVPMLTNKDGLATNAVYGFLSILFRILEEEKPNYLIVAFDVKEPTFRHEMYAEYKGTRKPMPEELRMQVPVMKEVLQAMHIFTMEKAGLEADDILGTMAKNAEKEGMDVSLVSGDRDLLQIASNQIKIRIPKTKGGKTEVEDYYEEDVLKAYQVTPQQFIELKALMGDTSDNIPGVPKVGEKTAIQLMTEYGSIANIYEHIADISKKSIRESLQENRHLAELSKQLATIKIDAELSYSWEEIKLQNFYTQEAYVWYQKLEFKQWFGRFQTQTEVTDEIACEYQKQFWEMEDASELFYDMEKEPYIAIELWETNPSKKTKEKKELLAVSFATKKGAFLVRMPNQEVRDLRLWQIAEFFLKLQKIETKIIGFDMKSFFLYFPLVNSHMVFDMQIAAYLCNPLKNDYEREDIANEYLAKILPSFRITFEKKTLANIIIEETQKWEDYGSKLTLSYHQAYEGLYEKLCELQMEKLFYEVEMPLVPVLAHMEDEGILVQSEELFAYGEALTGRITELEIGIQETAGCSFNINSPKQLGEVLFEKMQLPGGKKTKTGYSTAADVLEKLSEEYAVVADILEYRGLMKLKSTYADGLAHYIGSDNRIHTSFNQTITATGRISSTEPNLQNIPMRMELGRLIRKVFIPKEGCVFVDADYSQIELRILADMSGDEKLIEAYKQEQDIHRITASQVFHIQFDEVTELQRRNAKAVNFGIVYGISSFGLSQGLSITKKEAASYIEQYFATYPKVKEFLERLVVEAKETGYVTTLFGRRRPIPELKSGNFMQRSFGERVAMNSPIQGTAADIMKLAMIGVAEELKKKQLQAKLILQVHDEVLIEAPIEEVDTIYQILTDKMKGAAKLSVDLEIDMHTGSNWYEAK